jgi:CBS domain-containing protein
MLAYAINHHQREDIVMKEKLVRDTMQLGVPVCKADTPLPDVARLLAQEARDVLVVMGEQGVQGVVSQSDMARAFMGDYRSMTAQDIMTTEVYSVSPDIPLKTAVEMMLEKGVHQILVVRVNGGGKPVPTGVLSKHHLIELMSE